MVFISTFCLLVWTLFIKLGVQGPDSVTARPEQIVPAREVPSIFAVVKSRGKLSRHRTEVGGVQHKLYANHRESENTLFCPNLSADLHRSPQEERGTVCPACVYMTEILFSVYAYIASFVRKLLSQVFKPSAGPGW